MFRPIPSHYWQVMASPDVKLLLLRLACEADDDAYGVVEVEDLCEALGEDRQGVFECLALAVQAGFVTVHPSVSPDSDRLRYHLDADSLLSSQDSDGEHLAWRH